LATSVFIKFSVQCSFQERKSNSFINHGKCETSVKSGCASTEVYHENVL